MEEIYDLIVGTVGIKLVLLVSLFVIAIFIIMTFFKMANNIDNIERHLNNIEIEQEEQTKILKEIAEHNEEENTVVTVHKRE